MKSATFYKITNKNIYDKLVEIENKIGGLKTATTWHTWAIGFIVLVLTAVIARVV